MPPEVPRQSRFAKLWSTKFRNDGCPGELAMKAFAIGLEHGIEPSPTPHGWNDASKENDHAVPDHWSRCWWGGHPTRLTPRTWLLPTRALSK